MPPHRFPSVRVDLIPALRTAGATARRRKHPSRNNSLFPRWVRSGCNCGEAVGAGEDRWSLQIQIRSESLNIRSRLQSDRHDVPDGFDWYEQSHAPHSRTSTSESYTSQLDSSRLSTGTSVPLPVPDQYYQHHRYRPKARGTMQYRYRYAVDCTVPVPVYSTAVSCMAVYCKPYWYTTYYTGIGIPDTVHWESDNTDSHTAIRHIYVVYGIYTVYRYRY